MGKEKLNSKKLSNLTEILELQPGTVFGLTFKVNYDGAISRENHNAVVLANSGKRVDLILDGSSSKEAHFYLTSYEPGRDPQARIEEGRLVTNATLQTISIFYPSSAYETYLRVLKDAGLLPQ